MEKQRNKSVRWQDIKVVIFDVDGTLYEQSRLRKKMLLALLAYYAIRPWKKKELFILQNFRIEREKRAGSTGPDLENAQYVWCAEKGNYSVQEVRKVIDQWIFKFPNRYLAGCTYPGIRSFMETLQENGIQTAIYSDYPADDKLRAMGLKADLVVSSTDPEIDRLKPDPKGLLYTCEKLGVLPTECLFIGDRQEMDGECAIKAGMPYLIIEKKPLNVFDFYTILKSQFISSLDLSIYEPNHYPTKTWSYGDKS